MLLGERDPNESGRSSQASRGSDRSAATRPSYKGPGPVTAMSTDPRLVSSMLKTSTEVGGIEGLVADQHIGLPHVPRASRRGATSRHSTASSRSNTSNRTSVHRAVPSVASNATRRSRENNVPQYVPDTLSPTVMNFPGSSPLIPWAARDTRDGQRSLSMTMANTSEPTFRLSNNRSFTSLRSHDHPHQRPKSPYRYPTRLRRPSYRPSSPALSDTTGSQFGRVGANGSQGPPYPPLPPRHRTPSDMSLRRTERGHQMGGPYRARSPVIYGDMQPDIPPVPPLLPQHRAFAIDPVRPGHKSISYRSLSHKSTSHRSASHRSTKASVSSGSTNQRTDSDTPSSDATQPPTPRNGASLINLVNTPGGQVLIRDISGMVKEEVSTGPLYYDYTEQFESPPLEHEMNTVPTGFVHRIKTILEERGTPEPSTQNDKDVADRAVGQLASEVPDVAELPASPVPRRITRDLVLKMLEPASTTEDLEITEEARALGEPKEKPSGSGEDEEEPGKADAGNHSQDTSARQLEEVLQNRYSILSQADTSVVDSSTLNFAVRCSIPIVADNGITVDTDTTTEPIPEPDIETVTEDGMSDLLDGYQHTDTQQYGELPALTEAIAADEPADKRSNHAAKSSDEQSFKSCTDIPDLAEPQVRGKDIESFESHDDLPEPELPFKEADARSFKTCKDTVTPDRAGSMPVATPMSRMPSADFIASENRPIKRCSERPVSPLVQNGQHHPISKSESNISKVAPRLRANSKLSSQYSSTAASVSSFAECRNQQPLDVPPRESSSSKEAQRSSAVAGFLMSAMSLRPSRFVKANSGLGRKKTPNEACSKQDIPYTAQNIPTPPPMRERPLSGSCTAAVHSLSEPVMHAEMKVAKQESGTERSGKPEAGSKGEAITKHSNLTMIPSANATPVRRPRTNAMLSTSSPPFIPEASSVYSPEDNSFKSQTHSSPGILPQTPDQNQRDSHTTTHLSWDRHRSHHLPSAGDGNVGSAQTVISAEGNVDLRISTCRYPANRLPDLKEESHEDSSLNTSASNLKNSSIRFPVVGSAEIRASRISIDDAVLFGRASSVKSYRKSGFAQTRGLPSMNFSKTNLLEKLNEAFDFDTSHSLEILPMDAKQVLGSELQQSMSSREIRDKYRSLFIGLDVGKAGEASSPSVMHLFANKRAMSPELLEQLKKLEVPDINGLTQRISEMLPSIKADEVGEWPEEDVIMEHALEEINGVSGPASKRSNARLRAVPGSPNELRVVDDALYEALTKKEKEAMSLSSHSGEASTAQSLGEMGATKGRSWSVAHPPTRDKTSATELGAPSPSALRTRSLSLGQHNKPTSFKSRPSSSSRHSQPNTPTATGTDSAPWNLEKNYPWTRTSPSIDISLPPPTGLKQSPPPGPSHLRNRLSDASSSLGTFQQEAVPALPTTSVGTILVSACDSSCARERHRRDLNRVNRPADLVDPPECPFNASGNALAPLRVHGNDLSHVAGDRYPRSALQLPSYLHLPDPVSQLDKYLSDDEGDGEPSSSRKSRFGGLKGRRNTKASTSRAASSDNQQAEETANERNTIDSNLAEEPKRTKRQTFRNAQGMSSFTYHKQIAIDRVRSWYEKSKGAVRRLFRRRNNLSTIVFRDEGRVLTHDQEGNIVSIERIA